MATEMKRQTNIRLTPTAIRIMNQLTDVYGVSQGDVIELLLRVEAARVQLPGHATSHLVGRGLPVG